MTEWEGINISLAVTPGFVPGSRLVIQDKRLLDPGIKPG